MQLGSQVAKDVEGLVRLSVSATNARAGIELRVADLNNYYVARINGSTNKVEICKQSAGTLSVLASSSTFTVTASTFYWLRFRTQGTTIEAKAWADGNAEPGAWSVSTTDSTFTSAGNYGLYTLVASTGTVVKFDSFTVTNLQNTLDIALRANLANHQNLLDWKLRARLAGISTRDIALRAGITVPTTSRTKDIALRTRVAGLGLKDIALRACLEEAITPLPAQAAITRTVQVGGGTYSILEGSWNLQEDITERSVASFTIRDTTGSLHLQHRQPVLVTNSVRGVEFTGFVNSATEHNLFPNPDNTLAVVCIDEHYIADKRAYEGQEFANQRAGDIAIALMESTISQDGVVAGYALDHDTTTADFAQGTLSNVVASANVGGSATGDGDLELAPSGVTLTISEGSANFDFGVGTFVNTQTSGPFGGKMLILASSSALKITGQAAIPGGGNLYTYQKIWTGGAAIATGWTLQYDVWVSSTSPQIAAGVDLVMTDGTTMRDVSGQACRDQQQIHAHPGSDLSGFANDQWYSRTITLDALNGKTTAYASLALEGDTVGTYTAYFRHIRLVNASGNVANTIFESSLAVSPAQPLQHQGYTGVSVSVVTAYQQSGYRLSPSYPLAGAGIVRQSLISWQDSIPTDKNATTSGAAYSVLVEASLDGGLTFQPCTNNQAIPGLMAGLATANIGLILRETLSNTTTDPTQTPGITSVQATILPSYAGTKQDVITSTSTSGDWLSGTPSGNLLYAAGQFGLLGYSRTWDNASTSGQTTWGANSPKVYVSSRSITLSCGNAADVRSRLDFVGQWQDFILEVDIGGAGSIFDTTQNMGVVYRSTSWGNLNDTYAYNAFVTASAITLGKGSNNSAAGSFTSLATTPVTLSSGNSHRLKLIVSGTSHQIYLDDVLYLNVTDSSYTGGGYVGLRFYNNSGTMALHTTVTGGVAITSIVVNAVSVTIPDATQLTVDSGGAHPETVYCYGAVSASTGQTTIQVTTNSAGSGAAQAAWTPGFTHTSGASVTFATTQSATFDNFGIAAATTANRISPNIDLTSVGFVWDSYIGWTETTPGSSSVLVEASINNGASWMTCTNGAAIPNIPRSYNALGLQLQTRVTFNTNSVATLPTIASMSTWVVGQIFASGSRISPPLSLSPVGRVGDSLVSWTATLPNDFTTLGIDVSPDGINWTDVTNENGLSVPIITSRGTPFVDTFTSDQTASYTAAAIAGSTPNGASTVWVPRLFGGPIPLSLANSVNAIWQVDTANKRITATGGSHALLSPTGYSQGDGEIWFDMDIASDGGVMWALSSDLSTCYELQILDASVSHTPNRMRLYKVVGGQYTQLGLSQALSFARGIPTRFKVRQNLGEIFITCDYPVTTPDGAVVGGQTITFGYADPSPLPAGGVALRSNGGTNRYSWFECIAYGDNVVNASLYTRERLITQDPTVTPQIQDLTVSVRGDTIFGGALIPATTYSTLSQSTNTVAQDLDDLATQSNGWWRILQRQLYLQPANGQLAPFPLTGNDLLVNAKVTVQYQSDLYRNEQIILGGVDTQSTTIFRVADGRRAGFDTIDPIESISAIYVNGQAQSFGIQGVDTGKQWYYQIGQQGITQDASQTVLAAGTEIEIDCEIQIQVVAKARNEGQIAILAAIDGTSGVVTVTESAHGLNLAAAMALAQARLEQYCVLALDLSATTARPGLRIGHWVPVSLSQHGLINTPFLITSVAAGASTATINGIQSQLETFRIAATTGAITGSWSRLYSV